MHTVELEVSPRVVNTDQGIITLAGITVCVPPENDKTHCDPENRVQPLSDPQTLLTWKKFRDAGYVGTYRATPNEWHTTQFSGSNSERRRRSTTTDQITSYIIGENTTCDQLDQNVYCNGPLPSGTDFRIFIWACTSQGCSQAGPIRVATQPPEDQPNIGAIVGGIVAAVAVIALVVVAVIMYRRYRPKDVDGHTTLTPTPSRVIRKPIKLQDFTAHLDRLHKDSNLLFQEEFEKNQSTVSPLFHEAFKDVQENSPKQYSQEAATLDVNKVKNRYVNILPYDHTRVKLITDDDDDSSDFINANYIPGYTSPREYIATQGPMTGTIADFWRMMWEQKSSLVVMLSDLQEKGRPKVDLYWPGEMNSPVQYGDIVVELTSDSTLNKYTIRTFKLYVENNPDDSRRVTQYFIPGWEDYSANLSPDDVLDFIGSVRQAARSGQGQGPVCVHCSAGVGRTGTFIALDFLMQFVTEHSLDDEVDIYNLVLNMRHNRPYMVQSEKQYVFIHDTLKLIIDRKIKEMQAQDEHVYGNTQPEDNIYANQAFEPDENLYENTTSMSVKPTTSL
ncbi:receptor-type tyrosine-protein phosphatase beta-like [Littorina saxatilis]|uniref:receptor-type tyrosine-protein phosphatase beta-like n=1 Tax=Littorina saxatilis TaxID=31220 RepID=UPI0038B507A5